MIIELTDEILEKEYYPALSILKLTKEELSLEDFKKGRRENAECINGIPIMRV